MPNHVLTGQVPSYLTGPSGITGQDPKKAVSKSVDLMHAYHQKDGDYELSNYSKVASKPFRDPGVDYSQVDCAEVFLQAQKIKDPVVRGQFITYCYDNKTHGKSPAEAARTAFFVDSKDAKKNGPYAAHAPAVTGSPAIYSFDEWKTRSTQTQHYIDYAKYHGDPNFKAIIDKYIAKLDAWEAGGKVGPRPWIAEDTGASGYRDDIWGIGPEMLGENRLGNAQVAFAEALRVAKKEPGLAGLDTPGLTAQNFVTGGSLAAAMDKKMQEATATFVTDVRPVLMASVGYTPEEVAYYTSGAHKKKGAPMAPYDQSAPPSAFGPPSAGFIGPGKGEQLAVHHHQGKSISDLSATHPGIVAFGAPAKKSPGMPSDGAEASKKGADADDAPKPSTLKEQGADHLKGLDAAKRVKLLEECFEGIKNKFEKMKFDECASVKWLPNKDALGAPASAVQCATDRDEIKGRLEITKKDGTKQIVDVSLVRIVDPNNPGEVTRRCDVSGGKLTDQQRFALMAEQSFSERVKAAQLSGKAVDKAILLDMTPPPSDAEKKQLVDAYLAAGYEKVYFGNEPKPYLATGMSVRESGMPTGPAWKSPAKPVLAGDITLSVLCAQLDQLVEAKTDPAKSDADRAKMRDALAEALVKFSKQSEESQKMGVPLEVEKAEQVKQLQALTTGVKTASDAEKKTCAEQGVDALVAVAVAHKPGDDAKPM